MLTALAIPMDLTGSATLSDRTEIRARAPGPGGGPSVDVDTVITGGLSLRSRRFSLTLDYSPHLSVWNAGAAAAQLTLAHTGQARAEWIGRRTRLSLEEVGSYGWVNLAASSPSLDPEGQPTRVDLVPSAQILRFVSSTTTLAAGLTLRRWTLDARAGYLISGGADADARRSLPLLGGPFGEANAAYAFSRTGQVVATLAASETTASSGPEAVFVGASLGYRHRWSKATETWLTAGATEVRMTGAPLASQSFSVYPVAELGASRRATASGHVKASVSARLAPIVSQLTGLADERAQVTLGVSYQRERLTARALLGASRSVLSSGPSAGSLFTGELGAGYGVSKLLGVDAGARGLWQRQEATGEALSMATLFIGVTLRAPPARL